ncbi:putative membrane protein [Promicromonospora umidemergens]|uniref:Integral membrane protein n=1 Tax=Promicromonospora umidemergens TaxID=629679 RepID=A0ABP8X7J8_9MICO|nr:hypothetical protein [Promicromonospora umidemergens]MCP2281326.1 putative membrane protein [Promicromonospora umidemergens]
MSENTPRSPYEPRPGGPTPPPAGGPAPGPVNLPVNPPSGGPSQPPAYGGPAVPYGTQPSSPFRVGEALSFGWNRFKANWLFWVLFVLLTFAVSAIFSSGSIGDVQEQINASSDPEAMAELAADMSGASSLLQLIGSLVVAVLQALGINAALREVSGEKASWGTLFKVNSYGMIILAALLLAAASFVGALLCGLGLIAVAIFAVFTYHNVVDKGMNAWAAFTSSFALVGKNFGAVFLLELALLGINVVGALLCGLGLFVTIPLSVLAMAYAYRRLTGGPVVAA